MKKSNHIAIIGGGFAGINTAVNLLKSGKDIPVTLVDLGRLIVSAFNQVSTTKKYLCNWRCKPAKFRSCISERPSTSSYPAR